LQCSNAVQQAPEGHPETISTRQALSVLAKLKILMKGTLIDEHDCVRFDTVFHIQVKLHITFNDVNRYHCLQAINSGPVAASFQIKWLGRHGFKGLELIDYCSDARSRSSQHFGTVTSIVALHILSSCTYTL
jgi:hypothetical protein